MAEPPKRRAWFQLHLSTCVVMMVVGGAVIGLNVSYVLKAAIIQNVDPDSRWGHEPPVVIYEYEAGWPYWTKYTSVAFNQRNTTTVKFHHALLGNICFALLVVGGLAVVCEWRIRRRLRRASSNTNES